MLTFLFFNGFLLKEKILLTQGLEWGNPVFNFFSQNFTVVEQNCGKIVTHTTKVLTMDL